ncbi:MAG: hypothetical protein K6G76_10610 [Lachnospiraceae bacterium]|nr:hypothetical protein [Lachnospiraceae bacterium]
MSKKEYIQDKSEALEHKVNLLMGFGFLIIAILIISVNLICRFIGGSKERLYEYTDGL